MVSFNVLKRLRWLFIVQENQTLQGRIAQSSTTEEMRSMHDELSVLDEVR